MNKNYIKATVIAVLIAITVIIFRHINFFSEFWNEVLLVIIIFIECFTVDNLINKINKHS